MRHCKITENPMDFKVDVCRDYCSKYDVVAAIGDKWNDIVGCTDSTLMVKLPDPLDKMLYCNTI